ncbi:hypothetical protein ACLBW0_16165 [Enterobacteriaceae bacterium C34A]
MKRSLIVIAGCCLGVSVMAQQPSRIDLKDPTIWQEKTKQDETRDDPCRVFSESVCSGYDASKTDIQREAERRERNRDYTDYEKRNR